METAIKERNDNHDSMNIVLNKISTCVKLIRTCDKVLRNQKNNILLCDHRGRRHTKTGKNKATSWEIYAVIKVRTGENTRNIRRTDYTTQIQPDHSIIVNEKSTGKQWSATAAEIDNLEAREFGKNELGNYIATQTSQTPQYLEQQNKGVSDRLLHVVANIGKIITVISGIIATLGAIKIGPAVDTVKEAKSVFNQLSKYLKKTLSKLVKAISKLRTASNSTRK